MSQKHCQDLDVFDCICLTSKDSKHCVIRLSGKFGHNVFTNYFFYHPAIFFVVVEEIVEIIKLTFDWILNLKHNSTQL